MAKSKRAKPALTTKQSTFCREYMIDLNGTQAAIRAGYSIAAAHVTACRMLTNVKVRAYIHGLMDARSKRTLIDADDVVEAAKEIRSRCLQKFPVMVFDPVTKGMIQDKDDFGNDVWAFDSQGANKANELLARHLGMLTDKQKVTTITEQPLFPDK